MQFIAAGFGFLMAYSFIFGGRFDATSMGIGVIFLWLAIECLKGKRRR
ncbi:hypothetical protein [Sinorhizobium fredii]|nr:hypothetical protein [Sinorhizobium fredii]